MSVTVDTNQLEIWLKSKSEAENLEFKEARNKFSRQNLYEYCVAISNEGGGYLILGITNNLPREVVGTNAFENIIKFKKEIFDNIEFRVEIHEIDYNDKRVLVFEIPSRHKGDARSYKGRFLMRVGESLVAMTSEQLQKIHNENKGNWLLGIAKDNCSSQDVIELLDTQTYYELLKTPYPSNRDSILEKLESDSFIIGHDSTYSITKLGAILIARDLKKFDLLYRKAPRIIVYDGNSKLKTKLDSQGSKGYAVGFEALIQYFMGQVPGNEVIQQAVRKEVKMFPETAIRELVANALIHQDFDITGTSVRIELYSNRLEISNPGIPIVDTDKFINCYQSRNEKLADLMRRFGFCEEKGSGIDNVFTSVEVFQLPAPDFKAFDSHTVVTLFAHKDFEDMDRTERVRACYQHCCLKYVMQEKMTNGTLRERFKLPDTKSESISRIIKETVDDGKIMVAGGSGSSNRYRHYIPYWG